MMPDFSDALPRDVVDTFPGDPPSDAPHDLPGDGSGEGVANRDDLDNRTEASPSAASMAEGAEASPPDASLPLDYAQTYLKSDGVRLWLTLPSEINPEGATIPWATVLQHLRQRLEGTTMDREPQTEVYLKGGDRLLDVRQLQTLAETLDEFSLILKWVVTSRRQTALAAVTAGYSVEQVAAVDLLRQTPPQAGRPQADPLYLQTTVRSGVDIRHPGTIVILGDTNPGSALMADGDVIVWGRLRGMAHAGFSGDRNRRIMAIQMRPTQLRIADLMARPPEDGPTEDWPEVAYVGSDAIRLARAQDFAKTQLSPGGLGLSAP